MTLFFPIPSIHEINKNAGSNGLNVISLFAGCGGSSTGYKMAGCSVKVALEFVDKAAETYRANAPSTHVIEGDIRGVSYEDLLNASGLDVGELDILDGSPPCQTFSSAGLREKAWGKEVHYSGSYSQRSDDLFFEFTRMIEGVKPKVFVAENVTGLVDGVAKGYFKEIYEEFVRLGYRVEARKVQAVRLGVPQRRERIIFVGVRNDLGMDPVFPAPLQGVVTAGMAFRGLAPPEKGEFEPLREGTRTRMAWEYTDVLTDPNGCFKYAYGRLGWGEGNRFMWFKVPPNRPIPTITGKVPCLTHWSEPRTLSIAEAKRAQSFPDDFVLPGKFKDRWERIGRSVPPLMMKHIAETISREIFKR